MRVLYLSAAGELGGAEASLLDILASLRRSRPSWPLHLVAAAHGPLISRATDLGVESTVLPFPAAVARIGEAGTAGGRLLVRLLSAVWPASTYLARLRRTIRAFGPDVIHTNGSKMHLIGAWARSGDARVVWHLHDYVSARPMTARMLRWSVGRASVAVANSASVAADARTVFGGVIPVVAVLNAVDLERFSTSGDQLDLDALSGLPPAPPDAVRVGLVATFGRWKGHLTFLDAISRVPEDVAVRAYVIGGALYHTEGSQYTLDELRTHVDRLGLNGRVGFTGFVMHPDAAIRALDIVVHASTAPEPFGLVIAEAMACGRAVIASESGGAREVFTPGFDGIGHVPGDADGLAQRIAQLARNANARRRLGSTGRLTAERRFDRARLAAELVPVYEAVARI